MKAKEAYEAIVAEADGDCFSRESLNEPNPRIGLDGRFTAEQLKAIALILETIE
jgi:hypothetical protein